MTTLRQLKIAANIGEPDSVLALRIDVVTAAVSWYEVLHENKNTDWIWADKLDEAESKLEVAVRRYKTAIRKRNLP